MHGYCSEPAMLPSESPSTVTVSLSNATNRPSLATTVTTTCGEEEDMPEESEFNLSWIRHAEDQDHIQSEHPYHHQYLPHHLPHHHLLPFSVMIICSLLVFQVRRHR